MTKWLGLTVLLAGVAVALVGAAALPLERAEFYFSENGPIELATSYLWFTLALTLLILAANRHALLILAFAAALAGARELDAHAAFTSEAVTNLRYWSRDTASLSEKIVVAVILAAIAGAFLLAIRTYWRDVVASFRAGHGSVWSMATMILATPVLMLTDGTARYYKDLVGGPLDPGIQILSHAVEESGELILPIVGFIAIGQYFERRQATVSPGPGEKTSGTETQTITA